MSPTDVQLLSRLLGLLPYRVFVSGEELASRLGTHRQKVAELVSELSAVLGLDIFAVRGRGYKLVTRLDLFSVDKMAFMLDPEDGDGEVLAEPIVGSTNDEIRINPLPDGLPWRVMVADYQLAGRGRLERQWLSGIAKNLLWSCRFMYGHDLRNLPMLSLAAGLAVVDAIEAEIGMDVPDLKLKWPNDVYWSGRKLAGVLCESRLEGGGKPVADVVVGIGLNIASEDRSRCTAGVESIALQDMSSEQNWSRERVAAGLLHALRQRVGQISVDGGGTGLLQDWRRRDYLLGRRVVFSSAGCSVSGTASGLASDGSLLVETVDGLQSVAFGDVLTAVY